MVGTKIRLARVAAVAALAAATAPAGATIYTLTLTGTVEQRGDQAGYNDQIDRAGLFGAPGLNHGGEAYTLTFRIDTGEPWLVTPPEVGSTTQVYNSGINPYTGDRGEAITASFSLNGHTVSGIGVSTNGQAQQGFGSEQQLAVTNGGSYYQLAINTNNGSNYPGNVGMVNGQAVDSLSLGANAAFSIPYLAPGSYFPEPFTITPSSYNAQFRVGGGINGVNVYSYVYLNVAQITFAQAAVPEPASWGMMVAGFGLVGGAVRRRRGALARA